MIDGRLVLVSVALAFIDGCSSSSAARLCVPGAGVACACPSGSMGARMCSERGTFGACSCPDDSADAADPTRPNSNPDASADRDARADQASTRLLDLLVMVDNSSSMTKKQDALKRSFPVLSEALKKLPGGLPDLHLGVITSDLGAGSIALPNGGCPRVFGDRGILQTTSFTGIDCGIKDGARFLLSAQNGTMSNFAGDLSEAFACLANVGDRGCGYEQQLQAIGMALDENVTPLNKGFLRPNALLAIVLLTDEDDCSGQTATHLFVDDASFPGTTPSFRCAPVGHLCSGTAPPIGLFDVPLSSCAPKSGGELVKVQDIVNAIKRLKARPDDQIVVGGIYGWPDNPVSARYQYIKTEDGLIDYGPTCSTSYGDTATAGLRIKQFVESFAQGRSYTVCADDFGPAMTSFAQLLASRLR